MQGITGFGAEEAAFEQWLNMARLHPPIVSSPYIDPSPSPSWDFPPLLRD